MKHSPRGEISCQLSEFYLSLMMKLCLMNEIIKDREVENIYLREAVYSYETI